MVVPFTETGRGGGGGRLGDGNPKNLFVKFKFKLLIRNSRDVKLDSQ